MKKNTLLIYIFVVAAILLLSPKLNVALAQDAPNINVTKRRPDRPANYSPSPASVGVDPRVDPNVPDIKQVESPSFFVKIWTWLKSFFTLSSAQSSTPSPAPSVIALASADPTADWKSYVDSTYKYSFKYPKSWTDLTGKEDKAQGSFTIELENGERVHGVVFSGVPDLENDKKNNGSSKSFALNSQKYLFVTYVECDGPGCKLGTKNMNIFDQILQTFRFTN